VNANPGKSSEFLPLTERQNSLEITPCGTSATRGNKKRGQRGQEARFRRQVLGRSAKHIEASRSTSPGNKNLILDSEIEKDVENSNVSMMPLEEVKLECEEVEDVEISQCYSRKRVKRARDECEVSDSATKKKRFSRRRDSIDIPELACELCDFKCRFVKDMQKHYDEKHCSNDIMCALCGFKASTVGGLRVHSARKHNVAKNTVKIIEGNEKNPEEETGASHDETNSNSDENLANNAIVSVEKDDPIPEGDGNIDSTSPEDLDVNEPVNANFGNELQGFSSNCFYSLNNTPSLEDTKSTKPSANRPHNDESLKLNNNHGIPSFKMGKSELMGVGSVQGMMHGDSAKNTVIKNYHSITVEGTKTKDNVDNSNENITVELDSNGNVGRKDLPEDDPLTILKNVKAAHSKERVKKPKGRENKKASTIEVAVAKKDGLEDEKGSGTEDVKTEKTDKTEGGAEEHNEK